MKNIKDAALFYPWLHMYGGGEVFAEYTANKLCKKNKIDFYYYKSNLKLHPKIKFDKSINIISVKSKNFFVDFLCCHIMLFAQTYLIIFFNKKIKKKYSFVYSLGGEFFSKFKTYQYLHICIFSLNIFEYKNFGLKSLFKKIARLLIVIICRTILQLNKKKFLYVTTFSNSKWSYSRAKKTYKLKKHKIFYPCFNIPRLNQQNFSKFEKRKNNITILGRVSSDKNIIDAIKVFYIIKKTIPNLFLNIVGPIDKNYLAKIRKNFVLKSIKFHGLVSQKKRDQILKNTKYGLNFFYSEHFGRNVLEMQKCGAIVFARNEGGVKELLFNKNQKYENYKDLVDKVKKIHYGKNLRKMIYTNNQKILKKKFTSKSFDLELFKYVS